jgi:hypothetical protein
MIARMFRVPKSRNEHGGSQSQQQGQRKLEPVVRLELQLGQKVRACDAQKRPGAEGQRAAEPRGVRVGQRAGAQQEQQRAHRRH